jgi:alkylation response protein AidB-like acyl-CoA dehydrogenase
MIDQARLLTLKAAHMMDTVGNKGARAEVAMIKVVAPTMSLQVIDWASRLTAAGACRRTSRWRICTPTSARCVWPTDRTRYTARRSQDANWPCMFDGNDPTRSAGNLALRLTQHALHHG